MVVVCDTSPVSNLLVINRLHLLQDLFGEIFIPPTVDLEVRALSNLAVPLEGYFKSTWIKNRKPQNLTEVQRLSNSLDLGESEAIVLAMELKADLLLIDERLGTRKAKEFGLKTIGLVGVLVQCKWKGILDEVKPVLNALRKDAGFWISDSLIDRILLEVGEK